MYADETGEVSAFVYDGRLFGHVELFVSEPSLSDFKRWKSILKDFDNVLRERGIERYYTLVDSLEKFRWCEFLGLETTYVTINDNIELMVKEL